MTHVNINQLRECAGNPLNTEQHSNEYELLVSKKNTISGKMKS
jgi:hypothetical protein